MRKIFLLLLVSVILCASMTLAQNASSNDFTDGLENEAFKQDEFLIRDDLDSVLSQNNFNQLLDLNTATAQQLNALNFLKDETIQQIIAHRDSFGDFLSEHELQTFLDLPLVLKLLPFVKCYQRTDKTQLPFKKWFAAGNYKFQLRTSRRLERANGYDTPKTKKGYLGDAENNYLRLRYDFKNLVKYGVTLKKEAGEPFKNAHFDFWSAHFQVNNVSEKIKTICLGDYSVLLGQGLVMNNGFSLGKSSAVLNIEKVNAPIQAYLGSDETHFMRGAAAQFALSNKILLTTFASHRERDATVYDYSALTTEPTEPFVTALQTTGFHRTYTEIANKNKIGLTQIGAQLRKNYYYGSIALNVVQHNFDTRIQAPPYLYNLYHFKGKSLTNFSVDYNYSYVNVHIFGETAMSFPGTFATVNGMLVSVDKSLGISVLQRYYDKNYQTEGANAFSEATHTQNENGLYIGAQYSPNKTLIFSAYADIWQYAWLKYNVSAPSEGHEYFLKLEFKRQREFLSFQYRNHLKQENAPLVGNDKVHLLMDKVRQQITAQYHNAFSRTLSFKNRFDVCMYSAAEKTELGWAISSDATVTSPEKKLRLGVHAAYFDTPNYQTAIFVYEQTLHNTAVVEPYYYRGVRLASTAQLTFNAQNSLEFRATLTKIFNQTTLGSGLETINANHKTDLAVQWRLNF